MGIVGTGTSILSLLGISFFNIILDKILAPYVGTLLKYGLHRNRYKYFDIDKI